MNEHNLNVLCDQLRNNLAKFSEIIIDELMSDDIESPTDSWAWPYFQSYRHFRSYLIECKLWQPTYYKNRIE